MDGSGIGTGVCGADNLGWNFVANPLVPQGQEDGIYIDASNSQSVSRLNELPTLRAGFWNYAVWATIPFVFPFGVIGPLLSGTLRPLQ